MPHQPNMALMTAVHQSAIALVHPPWRNHAMKYRKTTTASTTATAITTKTINESRFLSYAR